MEKSWNKLNDYIKTIGKDVEDFSYYIKFDGVVWELIIEGISIDGEEQIFSFEGLDLEDLYTQLKNEW